MTGNGQPRSASILDCLSRRGRPKDQVSSDACTPGNLQIIAVIEKPTMIERILTHLKLSAQAALLLDAGNSFNAARLSNAHWGFFDKFRRRRCHRTSNGAAKSHVVDY